jgi:hypothetical protein
LYNKKGSSSLEDLLSGYGVNQSRPRAPARSIIPPTPSFDSDYEMMKRLASEEDDFKRVVDVFGSIVKRAQGKGIGRAKEVLREAHEIYVDTQKQLARLFGDQGQFDIAEEHLKNAHLGCEIGLGYSDRVVLKPRIEDDEVSQIVDNAVRNTPPQYFLKRVMTSSEEGDVEGIEKYISLSLKSLKERGVIEIPDREKMRKGEPMSGRKYETFFRLQMELGKLHKKAYGVAIRRKAEEAVGYAVWDSRYSVSSDKTKIGKLREEAQDLILDSVRKMVPDARMSDAFDATIAFFNGFLNPMYDELLACRDDESHPIRTLYRPTRVNGDSWGKIIGFERIEVETTAVVPRRFYEKMFEETGIPIIVHPFFNPVVERYEAR